MPPHLASLVYAGLIATLFYLVRERETRTSPGLWIALVWVWFASSRSMQEWLFVLGMGTPIAATDTYTDGSPQNRLVQMLLMIAALVVLMRRRQFIAALRANPLVVLFFLYAALSSLWSDYGGITIRRWFKSTGDVLVALVILTDPNPTAALKRLLITEGFLLIPHSILLIKYYPSIGRVYNRWTWEWMATGPTTHKNALGIIAQVYGVAFFWSLLNAWRRPAAASKRRELLAYGIALAMVAWLFSQAHSVTAQSCFLLACMFLVTNHAGLLDKGRLSLHAVIATLVLVPATVLFLGIGSGILQGMGRDATLTGRTEIWRRVLALSGNPLLGTGFESFWLGTRIEVLQNYQGGLNSTHNGYLEVYVTLGWIGVILLVALVVNGYRMIVASFRRDPGVGALQVSYLIVVLVSSFTEASFRTSNLHWFLFLLVTMRAPSPASARSYASVPDRHSQLPFGKPAAPNNGDRLASRTFRRQGRLSSAKRADGRAAQEPHSAVPLS